LLYFKLTVSATSVRKTLQKTLGGIMKKAFTTFAVLGVIAFASVNANAAVNHPVGKTQVMAGKPLAVHPPSNGWASGLTITTISVGYSDALPYFSSPYVVLPLELNAIPVNNGIVTSVQLESTIYSGEPTVNYDLIQNGVILSSSSVTFSSDFLPGYVGLAYFEDTPTTTGPAQIAVSIYNGSTLLGSSVYLVDIY
jgi:hypothetical protein